MALTEKGRELRNAYQRERYRRNKEKEKLRMEEYWNRKAEELEAKGENNAETG